MSGDFFLVQHKLGWVQLISSFTEWSFEVPPLYHPTGTFMFHSCPFQNSNQKLPTSTLLRVRHSRTENEGKNEHNRLGDTFLESWLQEVPSKVLASAGVSLASCTLWSLFYNLKYCIVHRKHVTFSLYVYHIFWYLKCYVLNGPLIFLEQIGFYAAFFPSRKESVSSRKSN